jgi:hypothetical protein
MVPDIGGGDVRFVEPEPPPQELRPAVRPVRSAP